jgi:hypothetical protein
MYIIHLFTPTLPMGPNLLFHYKASCKSCISSIVMTNRADPHPVSYGPDSQEQSDHFGPLSFFLTTMDMDQDMTDLSESQSPPQINAYSSSTINKVIEDWVIKMRAALVMLPPSDDKLLRARFAEGLASEYVHIFA